jgi:hypothetical protein
MNIGQKDSGKQHSMPIGSTIVKVMRRHGVIPAWILLFLLYNLHGSAQEEDGSFLFRDSKVKLSTFYVELNPSTSFSYLNDQSVGISELAGGFILNNKFYVAYFMTGSPKINTILVPEPGTKEYQDWIDAGVEVEKISDNAEFLYVKYKHSGLKFGYMHETLNTLFWRAGLQFGFSGGLNMTEDQTFLGLFDNKVFETKIITIEPHIGGGVNLLPWWRVHLDVGYRLMNVDKRILKATDTDSITFKLGFAFGNFKQKS